MTVRAIHMETVGELSTAAFLQAFQNFTNRRGAPCRMRSDQGTNFIGAAQVLANANVPIEWIFNTPKDPAAGGCWERLIGLVKKILACGLRERAPREATFNGILIDAENLVNSRPLVDTPLRHPDDVPLTPNHFLLGSAAEVPTPAGLDQISLRGQWDIRQQAVNAFWRQFLTHYVPTVCLRRGKWNKDVRQVEHGDIVVFGDPKADRGTWVMGRVLETYTGPDQIVRSAKVKTATGILHRPASRLAVLDVLAVRGAQDVE